MPQGLPIGKSVPCTVVHGDSSNSQSRGVYTERLDGRVENGEVLPFSWEASSPTSMVPLLSMCMNFGLVTPPFDP